MKRWIIVCVVGLLCTCCAPKEPVVFRKVNIQRIEGGAGGTPVLYADAVFYNPNKAGMKLRYVDIDVFVDGKLMARIDHEVNLAIRSQSEFTVPLEVRLEQKSIFETLMGIFGGKEHEVALSGSIKIKAKGFPVRVPVQHREQMRL